MEDSSLTSPQGWPLTSYLRSYRRWGGRFLNRIKWVLLVGLLLGLAGCRLSATVPTRRIVLQQAWELEPGDTLAGHLVMAGLGDISIQLSDRVFRAPFSGQVELAAEGVNCIYFSTPEIPAYLFRYCGVHRPQLGSISQGAVMGHGRLIHFATMRRLPDGTWAIVEPSGHVLERSLQAPSHSSLAPAWLA